MNNFIPYSKLSKKKKKEINDLKRNTWGSFSPITKTIGSKKAYNRKWKRRKDLNIEEED